jgi:hypothetical protein
MVEKEQVEAAAVKAGHQEPLVLSLLPGMFVLCLPSDGMPWFVSISTGTLDVSVDAMAEAIKNACTQAIQDHKQEAVVHFRQGAE